jgi:hypothetical protein
MEISPRATKAPPICRPKNRSSARVIPPSQSTRNLSGKDGISRPNCPEGTKWAEMSSTRCIVWGGVQSFWRPEHADTVSFGDAWDPIGNRCMQLNPFYRDENDDSIVQTEIHGHSVISVPCFLERGGRISVVLKAALTTILNGASTLAPRSRRQAERDLYLSGIESRFEDCTQWYKHLGFTDAHGTRSVSRW